MQRRTADTFGVTASITDIFALQVLADEHLALNQGNGVQFLGGAPNICKVGRKDMHHSYKVD